MGGASLIAATHWLAGQMRVGWTASLPHMWFAGQGWREEDVAVHTARLPCYFNYLFLLSSFFLYFIYIIFWWWHSQGAQVTVEKLQVQISQIWACLSWWSFCLPIAWMEMEMWKPSDHAKVTFPPLWWRPLICSEIIDVSIDDIDVCWFIISQSVWSLLIF